MKKLFMSVSALCLIFAASAASAQPDRNDRANRGQHQTRPAAEAQQPRSQSQQRPRIEVRPQAQIRPEQRPQPGTNRPGNAQRPDYNRPSNNRPSNRPDYNRPGNNYRPNYTRPNFNHNRPHARPDYSKYRRAMTAQKRYRAGIYHAPRGYQYYRWNYGQYLPSTYFARSFWLTNFFTYGLFTPPSDAVWVRYGPDALLVDRYNGEIISVRYNVFY